MINDANLQRLQPTQMCLKTQVLNVVKHTDKKKEVANTDNLKSISLVHLP